MKFFKTDVGSALNYADATIAQKAEHNLFPIAYAKAPYELFAQASGQRGFDHTREGWAGIQRYPFIWAGDWGSEWQWFEPVIRAGLNLGLSGVGYWSHCMGGFVTMIDGAATFDSATSFGIIRGGHVDASILGAMQVDEKGDLANWMIPGKKIPGMGGAMDLLVGAKKVILAMEHTAKGNPKILKKCTLPLTAKGQVNMIITEMGVMEITPEGIVLKEIHPEFTVEQVKAATEADLIIADDLKPMQQ